MQAIQTLLESDTNVTTLAGIVLVIVLLSALRSLIEAVKK